MIFLVRRHKIFGLIAQQVNHYACKNWNHTRFQTFLSVWQFGVAQSSIHTERLKIKIDKFILQTWYFKQVFFPQFKLRKKIKLDISNWRMSKISKIPMQIDRRIKSVSSHLNGYWQKKCKSEIVNWGSISDFFLTPTPLTSTHIGNS